MKKILILMVLIIGVLIVQAQMLYIPQVTTVSQVSTQSSLACPTSVSPTWYRHLCGYYWKTHPARTVDQPVGQPDYVNGGIDTTTQYQLATHTIWLLQHDTTSPAYYWKLLIRYNMLIYSDYIVVNGNKVARKLPLRVWGIYSYTLDDPLDPYSDWVDDATGIRYNTLEILNRHDVSTNIVVLQTCRRVAGKIVGRLIIELS